MDEAQRLRKPAETQEEPEQALRRECAALSYRLDTATDALKVRRRMVSESHGEEEWLLRITDRSNPVNMVQHLIHASIFLRRVDFVCHRQSFLLVQILRSARS